MPELQMDVSVANRFISSLSKSLQALCHGCMDFDSGIEIVGFINVNIDSGSKVDYVLHEKVLKSTTNSMTFVSNSFLARKEQPKQTRDGACSPVFDSNQQTGDMQYYQSRTRRPFHDFHPRSAAPFTHGFRGTQKRALAAMERDWNVSSKRQRDGRFPYHSSEAASSSQSYSLPSTSSQSPADANFKWPQKSSVGSDLNTNTGHADVNIKKEMLDSDSDKAITHSDQDQAPDQDANDGSEQTAISIKNDPDAAAAPADDETPASERTASDEDSEFKNTFLEPSTSEDNRDISEQSKGKTNMNSESQQATASTSQQQRKSSQSVTEDSADEPLADSEMQGEYDETGEEGAYPRSVYSDAGEGSSDAGQFEVIEIGDEDEDVQAMFGESQKLYKHLRTGRHQQSSLLPFYENSTLSSNHRIGIPEKNTFKQMPPTPANSNKVPQGLLSSSSSSSSSLETFPASQDSCFDSIGCEYCSMHFNTRSLLNRHMKEQHSELPGSYPYNCAECGRGFFSQSGLNYHMDSHFGKSECTLCSHTFKYSRNLKRHMELIHLMKECRLCKFYIGGDAFGAHIMQCAGQSTTQQSKKKTTT